MPRHTFGLMIVRVRHHATDEYVDLSSYGSGYALLPDWSSILDSMMPAGYPINEKYLLPLSASIDRMPDRIRNNFDYGRFGTRRRVRDVVDGRHRGDIAVGQVISDELRNVIMMTVEPTMAILAYEAVGVSNGTALLIDCCQKWFQRERSGYQIYFDYLPDRDAWNEYLDGALLKEVEYVRHVEGGDRTGTAREERFSASAVRGQSLPREWLDRLRDRGPRLGPNDVMTVETPNDVDDIKVVVAKQGRKRVFHIGQEWPRFTWEVPHGEGERPTDARFYAAVDEVVEERRTDDGKGGVLAAFIDANY